MEPDAREHNTHRAWMSHHCLSHLSDREGDGMYMQKRLVPNDSQRNNKERHISNETITMVFRDLTLVMLAQLWSLNA